jgi:PadR family transcriptional regulator PadR
VDNAALARGGFGEQKCSLIETALLIALIEQSGHGYALVERVQQLVGDQVYVDSGSVYRILRQLEEARIASSTWEAGVAGPQRRTYTVEPSGRELLGSWAGVLAERGNALLHLSRLAQERLA